jgi:hypothetical protein
VLVTPYSCCTISNGKPVNFVMSSPPVTVHCWPSSQVATDLVLCVHVKDCRPATGTPPWWTNQAVDVNRLHVEGCSGECRCCMLCREAAK